MVPEAAGLCEGNGLNLLRICELLPKGFVMVGL